MKTTRKTYDYVIGAADTTAVMTSPKARLSATIQSLVLSELLSIWQSDGLPIETVLDTIEEMGSISWEPTLRWLGHFYSWESYREDWELPITAKRYSIADS